MKSLWKEIFCMVESSVGIQGHARLVQIGSGGCSQKRRARLLSTYFKSSPSFCSAKCFSRAQLGVWKSLNINQQEWKTQENHLKYFNWLMTQLGYRSMEDWYNATKDCIHKNGGTGLSPIITTILPLQPFCISTQNTTGNWVFSNTNQWGRKKNK